MGRWSGRRRRYSYWDDYDEDDEDYDEGDDGGYNPYGYYNYRPRIKAKGGIKALSKRGTFGESWWAKRWIATLESFNIGARLTRGKSYARRPGAFDRRRQGRDQIEGARLVSAALRRHDGEVRLPPVSAALLRRLGNFPFWRGSERFLDALAPVYAQAASRGLSVFLGETENVEADVQTVKNRRSRKEI